MCVCVAFVLFIFLNLYSFYISIFIKMAHQLTVRGMSLVVRASQFHKPCHREYSGIIIVVYMSNRANNFVKNVRSHKFQSCYNPVVPLRRNKELV